MKIHSNLIKLTLLLSVLVSPFAIAQTFMSEEEMLDTFSAATLSGLFLYDEKTRWTQVYEEIQEGETNGIIKGDVAGKPYESRWFIRNGKWCENWGTGNGCYDLVRVNEKTIRAYEKGAPHKMVWEIL